MSYQFVNTRIDRDNGNLENFQDYVQTEEEKDEKKTLKNMIGGKDIIHLKGNFITRCMIPLENLFDQNYVVKDPKVHPAKIDVEDHNIGTEEKPKIIKLSKNFPVKRKRGIHKFDE